MDATGLGLLRLSPVGYAESSGRPFWRRICETAA